MKHEKFRLFEAPSLVSITTSIEVEKFLSTRITPKSISIAVEPNKATLCLGYLDEPAGHKFHLVQSTFVPPADHDKGHVEAALDIAALEVDGVICQDVHFEDNKITITFLTTK